MRSVPSASKTEEDTKQALTVAQEHMDQADEGREYYKQNIANAKALPGVDGTNTAAATRAHHNRLCPGT